VPNLFLSSLSEPKSTFVKVSTGRKLRICNGQQNLFTILNPLSCWHSFPLSVCNYLPSVEEKESRSLCGICDEDEKVTLIYFVEEKLNGRDSIVDGDTDRNLY